MGGLSHIIFFLYLSYYTVLSKLPQTTVFFGQRCLEFWSLIIFLYSAPWDVTCWLSYPLLPTNRRPYDSTADFRQAVLLPDQTFLPCLLTSQVALCRCLSLLYSFCWLLLNPVKFLSNFDLNFKRNVNFSKKKKL